MNTRYIFRLLYNRIANVFNKTQKIIPKYIGVRMSGNSTRIVDACVQNFFLTGECRISDHYCSRDSNIRVYKTLLRRLESEHGVRFKNPDPYLNNFTLKLSNKLTN